jgi:ubiquinone/menaquinone biosynthesis C-methylase UbiE
MQPLQMMEEAMSKLSDQTWVSDQYKDASNLQARIGLHERFSTNKYDWHRWVFDRLDLPPQSRILELGCGSGLLWTKNQDRIPAGWEITLSDLSPGMLRAAQDNLQVIHRFFRYEIADAQAIPFDDETFDAVIANHMLYHVPDRPKALSEVYRVLKPNGYFYAATNGQAAPSGSVGIRAWIMKSSVRTGFERFSLETGGAELSERFSVVTQHRYEDSLAVTEVKPLIDYIRSGKHLSDEEIQELEKVVEREIALHGVIQIPKAPGMFIAQKMS